MIVFYSWDSDYDQIFVTSEDRLIFMCIRAQEMRSLILSVCAAIHFSFSGLCHRIIGFLVGRTAWLLKSVFFYITCSLQ
jgi:hypothetical protein